MTAWPIAVLGDVVEFLDHLRRPIKESDRQPGPFPYYGANGQQGSVGGYLFDEPLVLVAEDGGHFDEPRRGIAYKVSGKTWVNNHAHILRATAKVDADYLVRVLENMDVRQYISGTTRSKLTKGQAERIPIPLPPIEEQRRIAAILDKADEIRTKRQAALAQLDTLTQSIFLDLFGDPFSNPLGWPLYDLEQLGSLDRGVSKHRPRNDPKLLGGQYPLIQTGDVTNSGGYLRTWNATYSDLGLAQSKSWKKGTLCITIAANIARTAILEFDACFPDSVVGFTGGSPDLVEYVRVWFMFMQKRIEEAAPESAQKNINLGILRSLRIAQPPLQRCAEFGRRLRALNDLKARHLSGVARTEQMFKSLQYRVFSVGFE